MAKDVVILGAGASAAAGAPLQGKIFNDYFVSCAPKTNSQTQMKRRLEAYFRTFFGIRFGNLDLRNTTFPTFEEALGVLEIALDRNESFAGFGTSLSKPMIQMARDDLIFLIALTLKQKLEYAPNYHGMLLDRLERDSGLLNTSFISLNYDILLDNAIAELHPTYDLDYGVEFVNFYNDDDWQRPTKAKSIMLHKLHGSLNWLYCKTCISLELTPKEKRVAIMVDVPQNCKTCGSEMTPIIIPPTFFKIMSNFFLQQIWRETESTLKTAERLFFCGYSFPDADLHVKYLLKRVEINTGSTPEIFIINGVKGREEMDVEIFKFRRFFKRARNITYTHMSFQDFCQFGL